MGLVFLLFLGGLACLVILRINDLRLPGKLHRRGVSIAGRITYRFVVGSPPATPWSIATLAMAHPMPVTRRWIARSTTRWILETPWVYAAFLNIRKLLGWNIISKEVHHVSWVLHLRKPRSPKS